MTPPYSCAVARQEARHVDEGQDRDLEGIAEAHEARGLAAGVDVEAARQHHRLVGHHADRLALDADEAGDDVGRRNPSGSRRNRPRPRPSGSAPSCRRAGSGCRGSACRGWARSGPGRRRTGRTGAFSRLFSGRKSIRRRVSASASTSFSKAPSATEDLRVWVEAPPSSSAVTTSFVTVFTTSGPVTNM